MTWNEFDRQVRQWMAEHQMDPDKTPIRSVNWDRDLFGGGSIPAVYVNNMQDPDGTQVAEIGED